MPSFVCWRVGRPFDNRNAEAYSDCGGAFVAQAACDPNKAINRTLWNCACMTRPQRIDGVLIWSAMVNDSFRTVPRRAHIETGRRDVPAAAARSPLPVPTYEILVGAPRESQPQARGYRPLDLRRFVILQAIGQVAFLRVAWFSQRPLPGDIAQPFERDPLRHLALPFDEEATAQSSSSYRSRTPRTRVTRRPAVPLR